MSRIKIFVVSGVALLFTTSCSSPSPTPSPDPQPPQGQPAADQTAVSLGVTIDSRDARGVPRLVRAIVPRRALAGMTPDQAARDHLTALTPLWMQHQQPSALATQGVQLLRNGASIVRMQQRIDDVDIHQGQLHVMVNRDGSLAAVSGTMQPSAARTTFRSTATAALEHALDALYGPTRARPAITEGADKSGYVELTVADNPAFRVRTARAKRELLPDGDRLIPIWTMELLSDKADLDERVESAGRRLLISDETGRVLRNVNLIANDSFLYRALADTTGSRNPLDGPLQSFTPHPTGRPDNSVPGAGLYPLVVMESFNGPNDPWLPTNATTTSGNNVDAFADIAPPAGFNEGDIRPEVRAGRALNDVYDFTAEPLATPTQSMAAAVNVFYVTNWLHDWYYDSGFTEAAGNAQLDNFGRGGVDGDPLIAHAQSNALGGSRDNANMFVPDDGISPEMNMFLWSGRAEARLTTAAADLVSGFFVTGPHNFDLTGQAVLADNGAGDHTACGPVTSAVSGKIAVFEFSVCASRTSVDNLKAAGAIGVIARIAIPGAPTGSTLTGSAAANLPGIVLGNADGAAFEATLPTTVTLHRTTSTEHDGDFDNAIVSHEWGHYLHLRLASCEANQCGGMSEGWGDFNSLFMMLRSTDNRDGTFGSGLYALLAGGLLQQGLGDPGYFGIRRFPYSIDRTKNALSFRHISDGVPLPDLPTNPGFVGSPNSEVHNTGEIWATMLWESYNILLDAHSFADARRRMSDYVVAGLLLTPPDATFTEARDAILAATGALDGDDMLLMAAAFAGRGAGTCALSPDRGSGDNTGVVESGTIAARLETSTPIVSDDGASCDHDGYLDPGESGTLRITVANSGAVAAEDVVITTTTTTPGVTLGKGVNIGTLAPLTHLDLAIPVKLSQTAALNSTLDVAIHVNGNAGCNTRNLLVELHAPIGVDEQAAVSTRDNVESKLVAWTPTGDPDVWSRAADLTGNHVLFGADLPFPSDSQLVSPVLQASTTQPLVVSFTHAYDLDAIADFAIFFDGGVIEVSTDGGASWRDVTEVGVDPGYSGDVIAGGLNPLEGRQAFSGTNPSFPKRDPVTLDFGTQFAGQAVQLRFRLGTDAIVGLTGWQLDDFAVTGITNTPFPGFIPEPSTCSAPTAAADDSAVLQARSTPRHSLDGVPGASEP